MFCFFKQKTAYELRISDWSSDVCSSDLRDAQAVAESDRMFRTLADTMPQMVWSTLPDGYHDYYNARWYEFTGVPAGSTDGEGWNGMFHPDDQERAWGRWRHSLRSEEHTSELQSLMRISYAVFCLKKKNKQTTNQQ